MNYLLTNFRKQQCMKLSLLGFHPLHGFVCHEQGVFRHRILFSGHFCAGNFWCWMLFWLLGNVLDACQIHISTVLISLSLFLSLALSLCVWIAEMPLRCFHRDEDIWTSRHLCWQNPCSDRNPLCNSVPTLLVSWLLAYTVSILANILLLACC